MTRTKRRFGKYKDDVKRRRTDEKPVSLEPGMIGFLVSATLNKTNPASRQITDLLLEVFEEHYEEDLNTLLPPTEDEDEEDIEKAIQNEIQKAQQKNSKSPFTVIPNLSTCLFFVQLHPELTIDPSIVVQRIFQKFQQSGHMKCRFVHRIIPFQTVCKSYIDEIFSKASELIEKSILPSESKDSFRISLKIRCNKNVDKDQLVAKVADILIQRGHEVNLNHPQINIIIEVIGKYTGISIVQQGFYNRFFKFNLQEMYAKYIQEKNDKKGSTSVESVEAKSCEEKQEKSNSDMNTTTTTVKFVKEKSSEVDQVENQKEDETIVERKDEETVAAAS